MRTESAFSDDINGVGFGQFTCMSHGSGSVPLGWVGKFYCQIHYQIFQMDLTETLLVSIIVFVSGETLPGGSWKLDCGLTFELSSHISWVCRNRILELLE